jgi:hypothetical protein
MARKTQSHWTVRAEDYEKLAREARNPEILQVLDHLARVCAEMAPKSDGHSKSSRQQLSWMDDFTRSREATAERWRMREAAYLATANHCGSEDVAKAWRTVAGRCAELAVYLEATSFVPQRPNQRLERWRNGKASPATAPSTQRQRDTTIRATKRGPEGAAGH